MCTNYFSYFNNYYFYSSKYFYTCRKDIYIWTYFKFKEIFKFHYDFKTKKKQKLTKVNTLF